jgi:FKBP-type peptidyl-prolyl cis-trans isomerase FkpA
MPTSARALALIVTFITAGCGGPSAEAPRTASEPPGPTSEQDKTLYALGLAVGTNLAGFDLTAEELEMVTLGIEDAVSGRDHRVDFQAYSQKVRELGQARAQAKAKAEKGRSQAFEEQAAAEEGATKTDSGLIIKTLEPGDGPNPSPDATVVVHYKGTLVDGTPFDSSIDRGQPAEFPLKGVIGCWTEGLQRMKVGEKARLVCPSDIAYGDQGRPPTIPGGATLVFEVQLLEIK